MDTNTITAREASESSALVDYWTSADGQATIGVGGLTAAEALRELLAQCPDDSAREAILSGSFEVST